jgi:predicted dithiol-disulfide oxidoreductase (DUF899 family)
MALETINGTVQLTRLTNESAEYVARREELRLAEVELMRQRERVAAMRRRLPLGTVVQDSTISVFTRDGDGTLRHSYSAHPWMADDVKERGIDLLTPVYNLLDLTPQGRDDWYAKLAYADGPHWPPR